MRHIFIILFCLVTALAYAQDTTYLKVHFLYGSKPLKKYKHTEQKWFGGILGGHVGIEGGSDSIVNFVPKGKFHWFAHKYNKHSAYAVHADKDFYAILGGKGDPVKKAIVYIPVSARQKQVFDSVTAVYLDQTPYDYAFFGMRCAAAAYDLLGQTGICTPYRYSKIYKKIFYPKKLRKRLFKKAEENGWTITRQEGSARRKWEKDRTLPLQLPYPSIPGGIITNYSSISPIHYYKIHPIFKFLNGIIYTV